MDLFNAAFPDAWSRTATALHGRREMAEGFYKAVEHVRANRILGSVVIAEPNGLDFHGLAAHALSRKKSRTRSIVHFDKAETGLFGKNEEARYQISEITAPQAEAQKTALTIDLTRIRADRSLLHDRPELQNIAIMLLSAAQPRRALALIEALYLSLSAGGIVIFVDVDKAEGMESLIAKAFETDTLRRLPKPFLVHSAGETSVMVRRDGAQKAGQPRYDYFSPSLERADLLQYFPSLLVRDPELIQWPYLRSQAPHIWRSDSRAGRLPDTGVQSVEEAELLYNNAKRFAGARGLEVGCHYAWSTAHILAAGLTLDVVDPALSYEDQLAAVRQSLDSIPTIGRYTTWADYSPQVLPKVRANGESPWAFVFIDGYHEGDAPLKDAMMVEQHCAETACVMFHDLTSPYVTGGLSYFASRGWKTGIYNTMQIMGIAWRGDFEPAPHQADPNMPDANRPHLDAFKILSAP